MCQLLFFIVHANNNTTNVSNYSIFENKGEKYESENQSQVYQA